MSKTLDLITIGRSSVDLYGAQIGGRLEDMGSFDKYIGGSPTNIACGTARLGLKSAVITGVGDEHMGRFIREQLVREGVNVDGVKTDPDRLTALVLLGIRDKTQFPLIFYRENCADMGLSEADIDPDFIARARCVCPTGTHLSHPDTEAAVLKALQLANVALRPALLRGVLTGHQRQVTETAARLGPALMRGVRDRRTDLDRVKLRAPDVSRAGQAFDALSARLSAVAMRQQSERVARLEALDRLRETLGYRETLRRGYAVVRDGDALVTDVAGAKRAKALEIEFADGRVDLAK